MEGRLTKTDESCLLRLETWKLSSICWSGGCFPPAVLGNWRLLDGDFRVAAPGKTGPASLLVVAGTQWAFPFRTLPCTWNQTAWTQNMLRLLSGQWSQFRPHSGLLCKQAVWSNLSLNFKVGSKMLLFIFGVEFWGPICRESPSSSGRPLEHGEARSGVCLQTFLGSQPGFRHWTSATVDF